MTDVITVTGPVDSAELGPTLFHEHLINNNASAWRRPGPDEAAAWQLVDVPVTAALREKLRTDPYVCKDNCSLDDVDVAVAELDLYTGRGGRTVVEQTTDGIGRNPRALREISLRSGVWIVMGCGYYLERSHPAFVAGASVAQLADRLVAELTEGIDGVRPGLIGEIGIGPDFTMAEEKVLRAAARAQLVAGVPLSVHLPGWQRLGQRVLDVAAEEGCPASSVVLSHLNPACDDAGYLERLAARGAWLSFDMIGMDHRFPGEGAAPADDHVAAAIAQLAKDGRAGQVLLSHDIFIKTLLAAYGGPGYGHVQASFLPMLTRHGLTHVQAASLLIDNPRAVFEAAAKGDSG
ncbi:phosphotriesterase-related protein [Phytoactinopolyspora mesophila]|uniref:Phosphotriesterase-related protein n=1 Tax=Phytoactinopolyspora mesophila TaxID=2650750 RepID=A0A7K3M703_9ACTN|nr:phosphotriesterase-related protein [Phytoactinopolyspora mesophila]